MVFRDDKDPAPIGSGNTGGGGKPMSKDKQRLVLKVIAAVVVLSVLYAVFT